MTTATIDVNFSTEFQGRGQWNIIASVEFQGKQKQFIKRVFAGFIDELSDFKTNNPSYEEISQFFNKEFNLEENDHFIDWCQEVEKELIVKSVYDFVVDNAPEYFGNIITSDQFLELIEKQSKTLFSEKTREYFIDQIVSAQLDWDNADEEECDLVSQKLADLISINIF
jgi:hypothetical protein